MKPVIEGPNPFSDHPTDAEHFVTTQKDRVMADSLFSSEPVSLRAWEPDDLELLRAMNTDVMWAHLGGPEKSAKVMARHYRYLDAVPGETRMFSIGHGPYKVGSIGYWVRRQDGEELYETGWMVLPDWQGRGLATKAARLLIGVLGEDIGKGTVHAYPSVHHPASNAVCQKAGFEWRAQMQVEFPEGHYMDVNDWVHNIGVLSHKV